MTDTTFDQDASPWRRAFVLSVPILVGYVPIGIAFGVLWVQQGLEPLGAPLLGLVVYAGASQFMAAGMLAAEQGPVEIALATLVLNARHAIYGLAFLDRFRSWSAAKAYFAFSLTDETYAVLAAMPPDAAARRDDGILWRVAALNQGYWVIGCAAGAAVGGLVPAAVRGLDFALTALFIVLLLEQVRSRPKASAALLAGAVAAAGAWLFGTAGTLLPVLAAALAAVAILDRRRAAS
ncbi:AzlC family ABC transporter permease [Azospirillum sp.]|uniref:AzlC family ABC transporter permease n=1 Tax=Azospirillum sp. TaxID=34012 RepID=UPI002D63F840|nr:AzlC family ABC transporter permease [Azospirillum sp.]HYD64963.1 AzlC family ABC transporter permease [Azospirillum sp.]